jgi:DNA-binding response OmpR family regulator
MSLLVVEDDDRVAGALVAVLRGRGFDPVRAADGRSALEALDTDTEMVLLDLTLPDMDGFEVCSRIRRRSDAPVIMVTARAQIRARIRGLEVGADDYLVKPYDLRELVARIDAVRRRGRSHDWTAAGGEAIVEAGEVRIDLAARKVRRGDRSVSLTKKEFDVLAVLARHQGVALPRERILREVWETSWKGLGRSLEVHVASIRRKLGCGETSETSETIETVRGVGYRLAGR